MNWPVGMGQNFLVLLIENLNLLNHLDEENILHLNDDFELEEDHAIKMMHSNKQ